MTKENEAAPGGMNEAAPGTSIDTQLTQARSLDVLARVLTRARPTLPACAQQIASNLIEIAGNLEGYVKPEWATHECQTLPGKMKQQLAMFEGAVAQHAEDH